jgi:hypothetical protein
MWPWQEVVWQLSWQWASWSSSFERDECRALMGGRQRYAVFPFCAPCVASPPRIKTPSARATGSTGRCGRPIAREDRRAPTLIPTHAHRRFLRLRSRTRRPRAQPEGRRRRHPPRRARRVLRRLRVGQVLTRVRHPLCRSPAALLRVGRSVRAAADRPGRRAGRRRHLRATARSRASAAAWHAWIALVGRQRDDDLEPPAHALFARWAVPAAPADALRRGLLAQHRAGSVPELPRSRPRLRGHRAIDGARRLVDDPRARRRCLAAGVAWSESARHPRLDENRRRRAVAYPAEEDTQLDPLH